MVAGRDGRNGEKERGNGERERDGGSTAGPKAACRSSSLHSVFLSNVLFFAFHGVFCSRFVTVHVPGGGGEGGGHPYILGFQMILISSRS